MDSSKNTRTKFSNIPNSIGAYMSNALKYHQVSKTIWPDTLFGIAS